MDGGAGTFDQATYQNASQAVGLDLSLIGGFAGDAIGDTLAGIEVITGSKYGDSLKGGVENNIFFGFEGADSLGGGGGNDILVGGIGADTLDGGTGYNSASYYNALSPVSIDLQAGTGILGDALGDVLVSIQEIEGSPNNDTMLGSANLENFIGGLGADLINGRGGVDSASYAYSALGVVVNLALTGAQTGNGDQKGDTLVGIEQVYGSAKNDVLFGDTLANTLQGQDGNDNIQGQAGNDFIDGGNGNDTVGGGDGNDHFVSGDGADRHDGGAGIDSISYKTSTAAAVNARLDAVVSSGGHAQGDTLAGIENAEGSDLASQGDTLTGNAAPNALSGLAGNDSLTGAIGADSSQVDRQRHVARPDRGRLVGRWRGSR